MRAEQNELAMASSSPQPKLKSPPPHSRYMPTAVTAMARKAAGRGGRWNRGQAMKGTNITARPIRKPEMVAMVSRSEKAAKI